MSHPIVIGELTMANLPQRSRFLDDLVQLARPKVVSWTEVYGMVQSRELWGRGIQWNDACLLASSILSERPLWTLDRRLAEIAKEAGVSWEGEFTNRLGSGLALGVLKLEKPR